MYEARPYGLHATGGEPTEQDSAAVELLARRLTNIKALTGLESMRMTITLPDGGYGIAQDMGGVFRVLVRKPELRQPPPAPDGVAVDYIPMLFSGVITNSQPREGEGVGLKLSEQTRKRLINYDPEDQAPPRDVALQRFRIDYNYLFDEFRPEIVGERFHTQYVQQRATWYSGAMAEVMQIVGGYGRQDLGNLPDDPVERARMVIPQEYKDRIKQELGNIRLPGYTGLPALDGMYQYEYKVDKTSGVGFDSDQKPWLLRVGRDGVWAAPLPLIPATTTQAFREYIEDVGDDEIIEILDRFGGMPSGERMPIRTQDFMAWKRAGVYVKVCDPGEFYNHLVYSSACGWSFNSKGTEGYNTCYDYYDDEGLGYGLGYKLKINLSPADDEGRLPTSFDVDDPFQAQRLNDYLSALYVLLSANTPKNLAIKYKIRRQGADAVLGRIGNDIDEREVDYWDGLDLDPIANHSGSVSEVARGYLYHGADFIYQPQIKFPEPYMAGCVSHDFAPLMNGRFKSSYPNSDTIMFGYYIGDSLNVVKYFIDRNAFQKEVDSDFEDCMTVGSWTEVVSSGGTGLSGNFYTSQTDDRRTLSANTVTTKITGSDLGYDSKPRFIFDDFFWRPGTLSRRRYYAHKTVTNHSSGQSLEISICIPYLCRNAVIHAKRETVTSRWTSETNAMHSIQDPTTYRYWTHDAIFAWIGGLDTQNGKPYPKDGSPVWVEIENYNPGGCSDFADQGSWIHGLPADYTWLIHPNRNEWNHSGGGGAPSFRGSSTSTNPETEETKKITVEMLDVSFQAGEDPVSTYFLGSPGQFGEVFYRDACRVLFGTATYANVMEDRGGGVRYSWGNSNLVDSRAAHTFIGVINE